MSQQVVVAVAQPGDKEKNLGLGMGAARRVTLEIGRATVLPWLSHWPLGSPGLELIPPTTSAQ